MELTGSLPLREELLKKYRPSMLQLMKLPGMGPKTVAFLWDAIQVGLDGWNWRRRRRRSE